MLLFVVLCPIATAVLIIAGAPARLTALVAAISNLFVTLLLLSRFDQVAAGFQFASSFVVSADWRIHFAFGVDGLSLLMLLLATSVSVAAVWFAGRIDTYERAFYACLLFISAGAIALSRRPICFSFAVDRLRRSDLAVSVPLVGARALRIGAGTRGHALRRRLKKIRALRFAPIGDPDAAGWRSLLDVSAGYSFARQHHLHRARHHRAEAARLDAWLFKRDAHGLHFSWDRELQYSWNNRRRCAHVCAWTFDCAAFCDCRSNSKPHRDVTLRRPRRARQSDAVRGSRVRLCHLRRNWSTWSREFRVRDHDFFRCDSKRMGIATFSHFPNRDRARALGRRDLNRLHVARLSLDVHGHNE